MDNNLPHSDCPQCAMLLAQLASASARTKAMVKQSRDGVYNNNRPAVVAPLAELGRAQRESSQLKFELAIHQGPGPAEQMAKGAAAYAKR